MKLIDFHYQYEETPYANPEEDYEKIQNDVISKYLGNEDKIDSSPPFPGSMITAVWQKTSS